LISFDKLVIQNIVYLLRFFLILKEVELTNNPLTLDSIKEAIQNQELRRQWVKMGEDDALTFLETLKPI